MRIQLFFNSIIALQGVAEAFNLAQTQANLDYDDFAQTYQDPVPSVDPVPVQPKKIAAPPQIDGGAGSIYQPPVKEERIAVPDPEPIKGGPSVLPPQPEKVKIAKEPQIDGGAGSIYRPPEKEEKKLISEPEVIKGGPSVLPPKEKVKIAEEPPVKEEKKLISEPVISKEKERIVGGPGTYPEPKKEKIAIAEP